MDTAQIAAAYSAMMAAAATEPTPIAGQSRREASVLVMDPPRRARCCCQFVSHVRGNGKQPRATVSSARPQGVDGRKWDDALRLPRQLGVEGDEGVRLELGES
jgi:hypothetical protein